jgi:hypothetical protein
MSNENKAIAYIRKVGSQWCIFSESDKRLGCYSSEKQAKKRLQQIEYFKYVKGSTFQIELLLNLIDEIGCDDCV